MSFRSVLYSYCCHSPHTQYCHPLYGVAVYCTTIATVCYTHNTAISYIFIWLLLSFAICPILLLAISFGVYSVTYPEFFWADRLHLGVCPPPFHHDGWRKFLNLVPPDTLKMHSLAVPVLRFVCKTFSKLRKLNNETLFSVDV